MQHPKLILASTSLTRRNILTNAGLQFDWAAPRADEVSLKMQLQNIPAAELATELATHKSLSLPHKNVLIIGADQTLNCNQQVYDKPMSIDEAKTQLQNLRGKTHHLHSAVAISLNGKIVSQISDSACLTMRNFSDKFLDDYLAKTESTVLSLVGAYQLESRGVQLFEKIAGDYFTILGLPLVPLLNALRKLDVIPS